MDAPARRRVVRHDDGGAVERPGERPGEPACVRGEPRGRILRREDRVGRIVQADAREIAHEPPALAHGGGTSLAAAEEHEVAPQRAAEDAHAVEHDCVVIEDADVRAPRQAKKRVDRARDAAAVELVVSRNVQHGLGQLRRPGERLFRPRDVAGEDHDVRIVLGRIEGAETEMEVGDDVELHRRAARSKGCRGRSGSAASGRRSDP